MHYKLATSTWWVYGLAKTVGSNSIPNLHLLGLILLWLFHLWDIPDNNTRHFRCWVNWLALTQWHGAWFNLVMVSYKGPPGIRLNVVVGPLHGCNVATSYPFPLKSQSLSMFQDHKLFHVLLSVQY